MREILFRGKRVDNGEWVYGYYQNLCGFHEIVTENKEKSFSVITYQVMPETIEQFTGLTDKNGKKIFEGDIVKDEYNRIMLVVWREEFYGYAFKLLSYDKEKYPWSNNFLFASQLREWKGCLDVIGNIHDNPELLEKDNA